MVTPYESYSRVRKFEYESLVKLSEIMSAEASKLGAKLHITSTVLQYICV